jgi:predicted acetyltransferase
MSLSNIQLRWFRDQGLGQVAADAVNAEQTQIGSWPVAVLRFDTKEKADAEWWRLFQQFNVNAMTHSDWKE